MVMVGRYVVELMLILMCGLGLHTAEVTLLGGPETFVRFDKVGITIGEGFKWIELTSPAHICW